MGCDAYWEKKKWAQVQLFGNNGSGPNMSYFLFLYVFFFFLNDCGLWETSTNPKEDVSQRVWV